MLAATTPAILIPSLAFPLFFFIAFAGGLSQVQRVPGFDYSADYTAFQFAFVLLQSAAFGGVFTGFSIARDFESGFGKRLMLTAPDRRGIVLGYWLAALVRWAAVASVLTIVAFVSGMEIGSSAADIVGIYTLAALVNAAGLLWSAGIALRFRTIQSGPLMQMPTFLILFFAPVYVPLELLSGWIHAVARVNPVTYVLEAVRSLLAGSPEEVLLAYGVGLASAGVLAVWALRGLRRAEAAG
jgi:ABC-2 type transport system permease protein